MRLQDLRKPVKRNEPGTSEAPPPSKRICKEQDSHKLPAAVAVDAGSSKKVASSSRRQRQSATLSISSLLEEVPVVAPKGLLAFKKRSG
jgi:hypothetical protein